MQEPGQRRVFKTKTSKPSFEVVLLVAQALNAQEGESNGPAWV